MTHGVLSDYEIGELVEILFEMKKANNDWYKTYGDCDTHESPPNPCNYRHYLKLRRIVREALKYRREHRKAVNHIWKVYADYVVKQSELKNEPKPEVGV